MSQRLLPSQVAYIQAALLYTASCGERRIRVATTMVPVVQELADLFRATDGGAQAALTARLAVEKSLGACVVAVDACCNAVAAVVCCVAVAANTDVLRGVHIAP